MARTRHSRVSDIGNKPWAFGAVELIASMRIVVVARAFQVLSDADKKAKFDRFGGDPDNRFGPGSAAGASSFGGSPRSPSGARGPMFDDEISPEELFKRFFGGGMGGVPFGMAGFQPQYYSSALTGHRRRRHVRRRGVTVWFRSRRRTRLQSASIRRRAAQAETTRCQWKYGRTACDGHVCFVEPPPPPHSIHITPPLLDIFIDYPERPIHSV